MRWGGLVDYLRKRSAFRVGEWILQEKKAALSGGNDADLLNNLRYLYKTLGDSGKTIGYYKQTLGIDEKVFGPEHPSVARELNNLGAAYFQLDQKDRARPYFEKALAIFTHFFGTEHPDSIIAFLTDTLSFKL